MTPDDEAVRTAAADLAQHLGTFWQDRLGDSFLGFYMLGSLAHGGFNRRYSDIDLGLVSEDGIQDTDIDAMRQSAANRAPDLSSKVSLFWSDRTFSKGRFPPLDRLDYLDHAVAVTERERVAPSRPTIEDVRDYLGGGPFENWAAATAKFVAMPALLPDDHKPFLRAFLYAGRFGYSWQTGLMASNDAAISWLHEHPPKGLDLGLLDRALDIRHAAADPDPLFPDRTRLPDMVDACRDLMGR